MPGPPPTNPARRRRNNRPPEVTRLPAEGRRGRTPAWPLSKFRPGETAMWRRLWATPQAVAWERLGWTLVVARYCRCLVAADEPEASVALLSEVRQLEDRLGLSPMAMKRLQWTVTDDEVAEARQQRAAGGGSVRRLRAVDGAVAGA